MLFYGEPKKINGYYFYLAKELKLFVSNKAVLLEKKFFSEGTDVSKVKLDEVQSVEEPTQTSENIKSDLIRSNSDPIVKAPLRRSDRVPYQSNRYYDFLIRDSDPIELNENNEDPITYMDAIQKSDSEK